MIASHRIRGYLLRHFYEMMASIDRKVDVFFWPTIDLMTFGLLTIYIDDLNVKAGFAAALLAGLMMWTMIYSIQRDIAVSLLEDAWSWNLFNLFATPLRLSEVIVASLIQSVIKAGITISLMIFLASSLFHFNLFSIGPIFAFYIFHLFIFGWAFGFITTSLILRFGTKLQTVAWSLVALIYPISGVFYPLAVLPKPLAAIARIFPTSYIFEGLRQIILKGKTPDSQNFVIISVLSVLYLCLGIWLTTLGFKSAKRRGWFIHPT